MIAPKKKILVPVDFSDSSFDALRFAAAVGHKIDAEIIVIHIIETYKYNSRIKQVLDYSEVLEKEVAQSIDDFRTDHPGLWGLKTEVKIRNGKIYKEILIAAEEENVDMIVMGTQGSGGLGDLERYFLGSNAYRVVYKSKVPVITLKSVPDKIHLDRMILALDVDKGTNEKVAKAMSWAKIFGMDICLTTVSEISDELLSKGDKLQKKLDELSQSIEAEGILCGTKVIRKEDVANGVIKHAIESQATMITIMTSKESILTDLFLGSTARRIIQKSPIPVLSTHPSRK